MLGLESMKFIFISMTNNISWWESEWFQEWLRLAAHNPYDKT